MNQKRFAFRQIQIVTLIALFSICFSCKKKDISYFEFIALNDEKLLKPKVGEWRFNRNEKLQTFEKFEKSKKIAPDSIRKIIYLQPIGKFDSIELKELLLLREYLQIYFQLETKISPEISDNIIPKNKKRIGAEDNTQLLAGYILDDLLMNKIPKDGIALMGIAKKDLYPKPEWNYVFGMASYKNGVGVTSSYRFQNGPLSNQNFNKSLERLIKISAHEIGHMFGINHCISANCVMNGTNSLIETDSHFARACSLCQKKLQSSLKFDPKKRLHELEIFFAKNMLIRERNLAQLDQKILP